MPTRRARAPRATPAAPSSVSPDTLETADRLHSAAIHLLRWVRREDVRSGLSAPRLSALSVVVYAGPITLGELAAAEQVRPPTMTRLVAALEAKGLVARLADPADGRVTRIQATARGRQLLTAGRARRVAKLAAAVAALDADTRSTLDRAPAIIEGMIRD
jgi:DNA-binding MarR family transcriptional regulator